MAATKRAVDMTNVKEQGNFNPRHKAEGDYRAKIVKVDDHKSKSGGEMWVFTIQLTEDQRATYGHYCGFDEKNAWKVRNLLIACGKKVPKKRVNVDPNSLVGKEIGVTLIDDEYEGKMKSTIDAVFPASDLHEDEDEDTPEVDDDEEETEDDTEDSDDDADEDDDEEDEEPEPEPEPVKKKAKKKAAAPAKKAATKKAKKKAPVEDDEDDVDELDLEDL